MKYKPLGRLIRDRQTDRTKSQIIRFLSYLPQSEVFIQTHYAARLSVVVMGNVRVHAAGLNKVQI